eukprot:scaffold418_cov92-Skeletonema_dohrnii-CCMP3373.AAC.2
MGRKRNQGKARKAAKARAEEREAVEEERGNDTNQMAETRQQSLAVQMQQLEIGAASMPISFDTTKCRHGFDKIDNMCIDFVFAFRKVFFEGGSADISNCLIAADDAAMDKFADVWNDSTKMETAISFLLSMGTQHVLDGKYDHGRNFATFARYFEQHVAVKLHQTQALMHWPKLYETYLASYSSNENGYIPADMHTLVKFFRKRIPCCCLDAKYEEVKATAKMGLCFNLQCKFRRVERCKTMYCSRCRSVTYCSPECQEAHWSQHKPVCDAKAAIRAKFDAEQQNEG